MNSEFLLIAGAVVLVVAILAFVYIETRPQRTLIDQLGGLGGIVGALGAFV